jgi:Right handed beta helix region
MKSVQPRLRAFLRQISFLAVVAAVAVVTRNARATDYYVATTGSDSNSGTLAAPFASMQKGADVAVAGDTVYIRGGTYKIVNGSSDSAGVTLSKSGKSDTERINFFAYTGELPIFDFSQLQLSKTATCAGIKITGSWLHLKGLEISYVPMPGTVSNNGIWANGGSNNTFELLNLHHNNGPGLSIANGMGGNLILNCDSHDNYDPNSAQGAGQNADGFGCHYQTTGPSSVFRGCRSWWNSDDGYDLISQEVPVTIENSWAMGNGYIDSGTQRPAEGNGNGFKAGSSKTGVRHTIQNCVAWKNGASGFYANHSSGGNDWFNNTSYQNGTQYNLLASPPGEPDTTIILTGSLVHKMRNNIGYPNKNTNMGGVDTAFNTWDLNIVPVDADFVSVSDAGFMGPRQADGSLPAIDFMQLRAGSPMIDKGTNVNLPFVGSAPDLGAYEFGASASSGGASTAGSGNRAGDGGGGQGSLAMGGASGSGVAGDSASGGSPSEPTGGGVGTSGGASTIGAAAGAQNASAGSGQNSAGSANSGDSNTAGCSCRLSASPRPTSFWPVFSALCALGVIAARRGRRRAQH